MNHAMKVNVEKYINDQLAGSASRIVNSAQELQDFLTKLEVKRSLADAEFDFDVHYEKTYRTFTETPDESEQTH